MIYLTTTATTDEVVGVAEAIDKYGSTAVILGVFIVLMICMVMSNNNSNKKLTETMIKNNEAYCEAIKKQNEDLLEKLIASTNYGKNYDEKDLASIFVKLNSILKNECRKVQTKLNADSLCIYVLHNGTVASHGLPFFKMSCICEWIRKGTGISSRLREHTNLPLTLFDKLISGLFNNGEFIIDGTNSKDSNLAMFMNGRKVLNCMCVAIYDNDNKIMGFMAAELAYDITSDEDKLKKVREELWDLANTVKPVLDYSGLNEVDNN